LNAFLVGVIAGFGIAVPVGAIAVLIVQVGIRCGFWCAASAGAGAATADLLYSVLAVVGGAALASTIDSLGAPFRLVSAGVLAVLAVRGLLGARREPAPADAPLPSRGELVLTYTKFLGLTIVNPLTVVYFAAVVLGLGLADDLTTPELALFAAGAFLASLSWQTLLAGVGAAARHRLPRRFTTGAAIVGNLLVLGMAGLIVLA
jgi:threonine/homoserine/homoserine lactone efflux protein